MGKLTGGTIREVLSLTRAYLERNADEGDLYAWVHQHFDEIDHFTSSPLQVIAHALYGGLMFVDMGELTQEEFEQELRDLLVKYDAPVRGANVARR